jgi:hypothetical protein
MKEIGASDASIQQFRENPKVVLIRTSSDKSQLITDSLKKNFPLRISGLVLSGSSYAEMKKSLRLSGDHPKLLTGTSSSSFGCSPLNPTTKSEECNGILYLRERSASSEA